MPMCFFRVCRHHSTKSAKWGGHLIAFAPLSASGGGGQLTPLPPGSAVYDSVYAYSNPVFPKRDKNTLKQAWKEPCDTALDWPRRTFWTFVVDWWLGWYVVALDLSDDQRPCLPSCCLRPLNNTTLQIIQIIAVSIQNVWHSPAHWLLHKYIGMHNSFEI